KKGLRALSQQIPINCPAGAILLHQFDQFLMWSTKMDQMESPPASGSAQGEAKRARYGLVLFVIYVILYGGFMGLSALEPQLMARSPFGGVNLAILYGLGLIVAAIVLALIYMLLCRDDS